MSSILHRRSESVFQAALEVPPRDREAFLLRECGSDTRLLREVQELIDCHDAPGSVLDRPPTRFSSGTQVPDGSGSTVVTQEGRYRILDVLGEGGMGIVYMADQTHPVRRRVALKIIKIGVGGRAVAARFESERQALALMNHPNIARIFEAGAAADGRLYFAMECVSGASITDYCRRTRLPLKDRLKLFIRVCDAIQHAHQKGIIHRDIKPSNVLVSVEDDKAVPKIIDFGVAKATTRPLIDRTLHTHHGTLVGSLEYMSPEQTELGSSAIDTRADIYSLGVLLYEVLVGVHPLDLGKGNLGYSEIVRRIREVDPPLSSRRIRDLGPAARDLARERSTEPASLARQLRGDLDWILAKAMEKDRLRRYASASELSSDLCRHLQNESVSARPPGRRYRVGKFIRRNRGVVIGVSAVILALTAGLLTSTWLFVQNRRAMHVAQEQRNDILLLSDAKRLESCLEEARHLVPPYPETIPAMEAWLQGPARELAKRLPRHRRRLLELEHEGAGETGPGSALETGSLAGVSFKDPEKQFQYDLLEDLVQGLEAFTHPDPTVGKIADVEKRLSFARTVRERTLDAHVSDWTLAIASIADTLRCPAYGGLRIEPQLGLIPLGRDSKSGLWEFSHLQTGEPPERDANGYLVLTENSSLVLVLIPGGYFWMGSSLRPIETTEAIQNGDPFTRPDETPPHRVCLAPFFISKYEMTQAQWIRIHGSNPSEGSPDTTWGGHRHTLMHPVENINWYAAQETMALTGLELPSEAQWEYAARGGTSSPWWCGWDKRCLADSENLIDLFAVQHGKPRSWNPENWDDGYADSSPVGSFHPNPFGLYDVIGNVTEWCEDYYAPYTAPVTTDKGTRIAAFNPERIVRGGDFTSAAQGARAARRINLKPVSTDRIGVRPVRKLEDGAAPSLASGSTP